MLIHKFRRDKKNAESQQASLPITPEKRRKIRNRIRTITLLVILIVVLLAFDFYILEFQNWNMVDHNLNIFVLVNVNVILLSIITLLLLRNLIKLFYERKKRLLGFRLKSKLTFAFGLVAILPTVIFFIIANGYLTNSINFWFQGKYSLALKDSAQFVKKFSKYWETELGHYAHVIVQDIQQSNMPENIKPEWFHDTLFRYRLDGIIMYNEQYSLHSQWFVDTKKEALWVPVPANVLTTIIGHSPLQLNSRVEDSHIHRTVVPLEYYDKQYYLEVIRILPGPWYADLETVRNHLSDYETLLLLERPIRTNYTAYLLLFTLVIIFISTWFAYYVAHGIIIPIETLVEGTQRIAKGDLNFQIDLQSDDEIGMLLGSFNKMTKELQLNKDKLAQSQEQLITTNQVLEERNIFMELVLQNIQNGVFLIDNSGKLSTINPYMIQLFQIRASKVFGTHYQKLLSQEQLGHFENLLDQIAKTGNKTVQQDFHLAQNRRTIHVLMQLHALKNQVGQSIGKLLVVEDLTDLDRSTRARAWREVARRIAHEIKNPLTPIQLSAQRIRRKYLSEVENSHLLDTCTTTIVNEVSYLKNMVNEFSKFARMPEINAAPININDILQEVTNLFQLGLQSEIQLRLKLDKKIPNILLDKGQMKRVFTNLIDNAVTAIEGEGTISLKSSFSKRLKIVSIQVADTGSGIPPDMVNRIFDPYVTTKKEGTGLGLAIVQQIVNDHGGFIRLEENRPHGTVFILELPS